MLHGPAFSRLSMPTSCVDNVNPVNDNPSLAAMQPRADTTLARTTTPSWRNCRARVMERFMANNALEMRLLALVVALLAATPCYASCSQMHALAQEHSNDMARRDRLDHAGFYSRAMRGARAENVAYGVRTEGAAIALWRSSPPHAANMRLPGCKAVAHACNGRRCYWTMEIGE